MTDEKCEHVLDNEETHCVKCLTPVWLFDNEHVLKRISEMEDDLIEAGRREEQLQGWVDTVNNQIEELKKKWELAVKNEAQVFGINKTIAELKVITEVNSEILKDDLIPKSREFLVVKSVLMEVISIYEQETGVETGLLERLGGEKDSNPVSQEYTDDIEQDATTEPMPYSEKPAEPIDDGAFPIPEYMSLEQHNAEINELIREFIEEYNSLIFWITDNQERTKDEYDRKIVDYKELVKEVEFRIKEYEVRLKND